LQIEKEIQKFNRTLEIIEKKTLPFFLGIKNKKPPQEYNYLPWRLHNGTFR
jgi:hypothetical protein